MRRPGLGCRSSSTPDHSRTCAKSAKSPPPYEPAFHAMERRCPDFVESNRWHQAVEDGRRFLASWGGQADALGWTARELFGLHTPPERPAANHSRLSRLDETGLIWLLRGRPVIILTASDAVMRCHSGATLTYRRNESTTEIVNGAAAQTARRIDKDRVLAAGEGA